LTADTITVVQASTNFTAENIRLGAIDAGEINLTVGGDLTGWRSPHRTRATATRTSPGPTSPARSAR
jgi:hypothetical protein